MDDNVRIARQLMKLAKSLVAAGGIPDEEYKTNVFKNAIKEIRTGNGKFKVVPESDLLNAMFNYQQCITAYWSDLNNRQYGGDKVILIEVAYSPVSNSMDIDSYLIEPEFDKWGDESDRNETVIENKSFNGDYTNIFLQMKAYIESMLPKWRRQYYK